jgi:DHA1 family bicyclomycin/chloramphenicol resistance-like MFS transporter
MTSQHPSSAPSTSGRAFLPTLLILGSLIAFGPLSIDLYLPTFPEIASDLGAPVSSIQLSLTSFFIGLALGQLFYGPLIDRFGRKPPVYGGLLIYAVASVACSLSESHTSLAIARFFQALGACGGMVATRAVVRDLFDERQSARVFSLLMLIMGIAPILAPLIGGYLALWIGWRGLFLVLAALSVVCLWAVKKILPETAGPNPNVLFRRAFSTYMQVAKSRRFSGFALAGGVAQAGMFAYITGSPFVLIELFGIPAQHYGLVFGFNALGLIAVSQVNAVLLKRHSPLKILKTSFTVFALASLSLLAVVQLGLGFIAFSIPLFVLMSALGTVFPNTAALALSTKGIPGGSASALLGTFQFMLASLTSAFVSSFHDGTAMPMTGTLVFCSLLSLALFSFASRSIEPPKGKGPSPSIGESPRNQSPSL